ncbi:MAG: DUF4112 domain-containing protein [Polyangiaceae bacterium]|nr:DUF4112 domain-containing protein [Polyangiaceae bacterium]
MARTPGETARIEGGLSRLHGLARLMDNAFELPIVRYRIGIDPLVGLIPGAGDWITWGVSVYVFWQAMRMGAPVGLLLRMAMNLTADLVAGYVPGVGDVLDATFKANSRNVELLLEHFGARLDPGTPGRIVLEPGAPALPDRSGPMRYVVGAALVGVLFVLAALPWVIIAWLAWDK